MFGRPLLVRSVALITCAAVVGCSRGPAPPFVPKIAVVADSDGFAPGTFGAEAATGLAACTKTTGSPVDTATTRGTDYEGQLQQLATENYDLVVAAGGEMASDLANVAHRFELVHFGIIDGVVDLPNVTSVTFDVREGSFLAGALAALVTHTKRVAFLGGAPGPRLVPALAGFEAGVREIEPGVTVATKYVGSFTDEAAGAASAKALYASGSDIVYVVAGRAGLGAIAAARALPHAYAIGADSDQDALAPGKVLTSVLRRFDAAAARLCLESSAQKQSSGIETLGLADGGVGLTRFRYSAAVVGAANIARIGRLRDAIVAGTISVPADEAGVAAFRPVVVR